MYHWYDGKFHNYYITEDNNEETNFAKSTIMYKLIHLYLDKNPYIKNTSSAMRKELSSQFKIRKDTLNPYITGYRICSYLPITRVDRPTLNIFISLWYIYGVGEYNFKGIKEIEELITKAISNKTTSKKPIDVLKASSKVQQEDFCKLIALYHKYDKLKWQMDTGRI